MIQPWMKFYPGDWRSDPALRMCSIAARGLWMDMLCIMHEANPRGSLLVNSSVLNDRDLAQLCGCSVKEAKRLLDELDRAGVFSREGKIIFSRRMRRDDEKSARDKANGKSGGNPKLKGGVNPKDNTEVKAYKLELESESKKDAACAALGPDLQRDYYARGKDIFGKESGGLLAKLLKVKKGNVALARAALEMASSRQDPREYIGAILAGGNASEEGRRLTNDEVFYGVGRTPGII